VGVDGTRPRQTQCPGHDRSEVSGDAGEVGVDQLAAVLGDFLCEVGRLRQAFQNAAGRAGRAEKFLRDPHASRLEETHAEAFRTTQQRVLQRRIATFQQLGDHRPISTAELIQFATDKSLAGCKLVEQVGDREGHGSRLFGMQV